MKSKTDRDFHKLINASFNFISSLVPMIDFRVPNRNTIDETKLRIFEAVGLFRIFGTNNCTGLRISLKTKLYISFDACKNENSYQPTKDFISW